MDHLALAALVRIVRFYKWAFGDLTDTDSDIGVIGEFLVGDTLGCLSEGRKAQDVFDLRTADDVSIEVKSTTTTKVRATGDPIRSWMVSDQRTALEGKRRLRMYGSSSQRSFRSRRRGVPRSSRSFPFSTPLTGPAGWCLGRRCVRQGVARGYRRRR